MMQSVRDAIAEQRLTPFASAFLQRYRSSLASMAPGMVEG